MEGSPHCREDAEKHNTAVKKVSKFDAGGPEKLIINFAWPMSYDDCHSQLKYASLSFFNFDGPMMFFSSADLLLLRALLSSGLSHYRPCVALVFYNTTL